MDSVGSSRRQASTVTNDMPLKAAEARLSHTADQSTQESITAYTSPAEHSDPSDTPLNDHSTGFDTTIAPRTNRFSLTFPILPASKETSPVRSAFPTDTSIDSITAGPSDGNFLTAIAAQERRVLEIKEELHRAEAELNKLKLQWATHEAQKKKDEVKKTTKLRPLSMVLPQTDEHDVTGSNAWMQHEMERRKLLMSSARNSSRRVFSGSKHTRTLSLLSPMNTVPNQDIPHRPRGATSPAKSKEKEIAKAQPLPRAATSPTLGSDVDKAAINLDLSNVDKELLLKTGKKMAMDLKDGIWTFWEDLRQATVGEDMVQIIPPAHLRHQSSGQTIRSPRRGGSKSSMRGSPRTSRASADLKKARSPTPRRASPKKEILPLFDETESNSAAKYAVQDTPATTKRATKHVKAPSVAISAASSDAFDAWDDSPKPSCASSATSDDASKDASPLSRHEAFARDPIPWPNIAKFGPGTLRRTASHLMSEWEKLSPPANGDSADYLAADVPMSVGKARKHD